MLVAAALAAAVVAYPAAQTIHASGPLPPGGTHAVTLATATDEREDAVLVVAGAQQVAVVAPARIGPLPVELAFAHYVSFGSRLVPDALLPWDGAARATEQPNQPLWLRVIVPTGTPAGTYTGTVEVDADDTKVTVPVTVRVFPVTLPPPNDPAGNVLTSFHLSAETYGNTVASLDGLAPSQQPDVFPPLYAFLASYRISPQSWGYGEPTSTAGYTTDRRWWRDAADNMVAEAGADGPAFAAMRLPISNNRTSRASDIAGLAPTEPETWCPYLQSVRTFWADHGWLAAVPYLYPYDEPGRAQYGLLARQATALHTCFPGARDVVTASPTDANRTLWDGRGTDDVDVWAVLTTRYYGEFTVPRDSRAGRSRERARLATIDAARARGKDIWAYTYAGTGTPGFTATEPLADGRMLFLWAALEGIDGVLYAEGTTNYYRTNPYERVDAAGAEVLLYPAAASPVPSARLEQIRDGIEDWALFRLVRARAGLAAVRRILGGAGLFSATAAGVELACTIGCRLRSATPYSWPLWSHDGTTADRIAAARLQALQLLAGA